MPHMVYLKYLYLHIEYLLSGPSFSNVINVIICCFMFVLYENKTFEDVFLDSGIFHFLYILQTIIRFIEAKQKYESIIERIISCSPRSNTIVVVHIDNN